MKAFAIILMVFGFSSSAVWARSVLVVSGMQQEGQIAAGPGIISVLSGGNIKTLMARLSKVNPSSVRAVVSFGVAGGLDRHLDAGSVAVGTKVITDDGIVYPASKELVQEMVEPLRHLGVPVVVGSWVGSNIERPTAQEKEELGALTSAVAVDMESQGAAAWAHAHHIPFTVMRTISDPVDFSLPPLAATAVNPDGSYNLGAIFEALMKDPSQLPALIETGVYAYRAFNRLKIDRDIVDLGDI